MPVNRILKGLVIAWLIGVTPSYANNPVVAIIIDDMGYQMVRDRNALSLDGPLTFSILPNAPGAQHVLQVAKANGFEVMLHLPMESADNSRRYSPGTLTHSMNWITFVRTVQRNLAAVPGIVAINNHEGSRLTADSQRMHWLMEELSRHQNIAFVDSRTTHHTVALKLARQYGLPSTRRDIFLDYAPGKIKQQFQEMIDKARRDGSVVAIAHPHAETIAFLEEHLGELKQQGIELVPISRLIALRERPASSTGG